MANLRIASTRAQDLQSLAAAGQAGIEAWGALQALLARELSPDHAALLAEPVANDAQGTVDWYAEGDAPASPLQDLPEPTRAKVQATLDRQIAEIEALAARLATSRTDGDRFLSDMLGLALRIPGPEFIYARGLRPVLGAHPVLVAWAHTRTGGRGGDVLLTGRAMAPTNAPMAILPPPPSPYAQTAPIRTKLWAALGLSLLAPLLALFLVLQDPFGWFAVEIPQCRLEPGQLGLEQGLQEAVARESVLRTELARLTADAGQRRLQCQPERAATPPPPPQPPQSDDARRAERQGGHGGKLQIILAWDDVNDLDLRVVCPGGADINFIRRQNCGGTLDIDANGDVNHLTPTPVENVYFDDPPPGRYRVIVDPYGMRTRPSSPYRVTIRKEGQPDQLIQGVAQNGQRMRSVAEFDVGASP